MDGDDAHPSDFKYVPIRRLSLYIEESLYRGLKWVVFEPNDEPLWAQIRLNIGAFMQNLFRQGAFQGKTPQEAPLDIDWSEVRTSPRTSSQASQKNSDTDTTPIWKAFEAVRDAAREKGAQTLASRSCRANIDGIFRQTGAPGDWSGAITKVTRALAGSAPRHFGFSPDGKTLAFGLRGDIWTVAMEKSKGVAGRSEEFARRLTDWVGDDSDFRYPLANRDVSIASSKLPTTAKASAGDIS